MPYVWAKRWVRPGDRVRYPNSASTLSTGTFVNYTHQYWDRDPYKYGAVQPSGDPRQDPVFVLVELLQIYEPAEPEPEPEPEQK